jgi:hypothetical protein
VRREPVALAQVRGWPAVVDVVTAGRALGLGRTASYALARQGAFPCPVIRAGNRLLVPTAGLLAVLDPHACACHHKTGDTNDNDNDNDNDEVMTGRADG